MGLVGEMAQVKNGKVSDYRPDPANANQGTERGVFMVEESLQQTGAGRSIVVDKNGIIIAGNKTQQGAADSGITEVIEVETNGNQLVVVKRTDLDLLSDDKRARLLAYYDNRASQVGLDWNIEQLIADLDDGMDLSGLWFEGELERLIHPGDPIDPNAEWTGMPEFEQDDLLAAYSLKVNFKSLEDLQAFAKLIEQNLTEHTRSVWYPREERANKKQIAWTANGS